MSVVSDIYSKALFNAAKSKDVLQTVVGDIKSLESLFAVSPDILQVFQNKSIEKKELSDAVDAIIKQKSINIVTGNFLKTLINARKFSFIIDIFHHFHQLVKIDQNEVSVVVTSARALEKKQVAEITDILKQKIGKTISMHERINPDLIGGMIVQVGTEIYDASIRAQISEIKTGLERLGS